jgi:hypothetical protein
MRRTASSHFALGALDMAIIVKAYANADDVFIAWRPDQWSEDWVGFQLEGEMTRRSK